MPEGLFKWFNAAELLFKVFEPFELVPTGTLSP